MKTQYKLKTHNAYLLVINDLVLCILYLFGVGLLRKHNRVIFPCNDHIRHSGHCAARWHCGREKRWRQLRWMKQSLPSSHCDSRGNHLRGLLPNLSIESANVTIASPMLANVCSKCAIASSNVTNACWNRTNTCYKCTNTCYKCTNTCYNCTNACYKSTIACSKCTIACCRQSIDCQVFLLLLIQGSGIINYWEILAGPKKCIGHRTKCLFEAF